MDISTTPALQDFWGEHTPRVATIAHAMTVMLTSVPVSTVVKEANVDGLPVFSFFAPGLISYTSLQGIPGGCDAETFMLAHNLLLARRLAATVYGHHGTPADTLAAVIERHVQQYPHVYDMDAFWDIQN